MGGRSSEVNGEVQQRRGFPQKILDTPLRPAKIQNEVHMQITKQDIKKRVLEGGHTNGSKFKVQHSSGNIAAP